MRLWWYLPSVQQLEVTMLAFYMLVSFGLCCLFYSGPLWEPGVNDSWESTQFPLV